MPVSVYGPLAVPRAIWAIWGDESGQDLAEYAFLLSLLALAIVTLLFNFRDVIAKAIGQARDCLTSVETNDPGTCPG